MNFLDIKSVKRISKENKGEAKKASFKSVILAGVVTTVIIVLAPNMKDNALFVGLAFGAFAFFSSFTTSLYEIDLLKKVKDLSKKN